MKLKKLLFALLLITAWCNVMAQQPYGGCWHPDYVINWTPDNDPEAKFNKSTIALQPRITNNTVLANNKQTSKNRVAACLTMNPMCSQTPSQGANNFIGYNPTYWQYIDMLIWWGGSAGEGIIIPPSAPVTDIAHLNGVKVLGQIFFPPETFGGQAKWVDEMLTQEGDTFPYAKKMYEIAAYYGFDGWFINEETRHGADYTKWVKWITYYQKCAQEGGHPEMEIQWYDNGKEVEGKQDLFAIHNASYFLDYHSEMNDRPNRQRNKMTEYGYSEEDYYKKVYYGLNVASAGINGGSYFWKQLFDIYTGSLDLFNPEEATWKKTVKPLLDTENACGTQAYEAMKTVFSNEARYWTNQANDPSNTEGLTSGFWPGFSNGIPERSAIQSLPFVSSFSAGLGKYRFVNGEKRGTQDWYHRGMQDIMPTWRWWVDVAKANKKDLTFDLNWDDAYNMGTSVKVTSAKLQSGVDYVTRLYKTSLKMSNGGKFQLVVKGQLPSTIELKLGTAESNNALTTIALEEAGQSNGWTILSADLSAVANKTVTVVALNFKGNSSCDFLLGQLEILPANYAPTALKATNLKCQNKLGSEGGDLRLIWDAPASEDLHHFNVYVTSNGKRTLVGQTRNEGFFCDKITREGNEKSVKAEVTAVTKDMKEGKPVSIEVAYPATQKPNVKIVANTTLIATGGTVDFIALADNSPETYSWVIPAGAIKVSENNEKLTLKFNEEGYFDIAVTVGNKVGQTTASIKDFIRVSNANAEKLENVAVHKYIHSVSGSLDPEVPENIIDGEEIPSDSKAKWCIGGKKEHWVVIDLTQTYDIYSFKFFDCGHKENAEENVKNYKIWVSNDAENWGEPVVDATDRLSENTKEDHIKATKGRYVKFMPYDNDKAITIRIWEFEVFGLDGGPMFEVENNVSLALNETKDINFKYDLSGDNVAEDFDVNVSSEKNEVVSIDNVNIDKANKTVSFKLNANTTKGFSDVTVKFTNNGWIKTKVMKIEVKDASETNVLLNKKAEVSYLFFEEWTTEATNNLTDGDMTTDFYTEIDGGECVKITVDCEAIHSFSKITIKGDTELNKIRCEVSATGEEGSYFEVGQSTQHSFVLNEGAKGRFIRLYLTTPEFSTVWLKEIEAYGKMISTGIEENLNKFTVYPTIFDQSFTVCGAEGEIINVSNISGMQIYNATIESQEATVTTENWAAGIYFVRVGNQVVKIIRK